MTEYASIKGQQTAEPPQSAPNAIVLFKLMRKQILFANAHAYQLLSIKQGDTQELVRQLVEKFGELFMDDAHLEKGEHHGEWTPPNKNRLQYALYPLKTAEGLIVYRDLAMIQSMQRESVFQNRLQTVGRLTSLVSNEMLRPLQKAIIELEEMAEEHKASLELPVKLRVKSIIQDLGKLWAQGQRLFQFSAHFEVVKSEVSLLEAVAFVEVMLMESLEMRKIDLEVDLQPMDLTCQGDLNLLQQVLVNCVLYLVETRGARNGRLRLVGKKDGGRTVVNLRFVPGKKEKADKPRPAQSISEIPELEMADWIIHAHEGTLMLDLDDDGSVALGIELP